MKTKVMLSLVAMTATPLTALADADISSQVGTTVQSWEKPGAVLQLNNGIFISTDGTQMSQQIGKFVKGSYKLSATTLDNAKLYVNNKEVPANGVFTLASEQTVTISVKAATAGRQFKVGGLKFELVFDFKSLYDRLNTRLSTAFNKLNAENSQDAWELELLSQYESTLSVDIEKVKDDRGMDSYNAYKSLKLYNEPSDLENNINTFVANVEAALANLNARTYANDELGKVETAWNALNQKLSIATPNAKELYAQTVAAISADIEAQKDAVEAAYAGRTAAASYPQNVVDETCTGLKTRIQEASAGIDNANGNSYDFNCVKSQIDDAIDLYNTTVQDLVKYIVADAAGNSYEAILQHAQTALSKEYAKIADAEKANAENATANRADNEAKIADAKAQIDNLSAQYKAKYNSYKAAYADVKTSLEDPVDGIDNALKRIGDTSYNADIQTINEKIDAIKATFAQGMQDNVAVPGYAAAKTEVDNLLSALRTATDGTISNYNANQAVLATLSDLQTKLTKANTDVNALASKKGDYKGAGRWTTTPAALQTRINNFRTAIAAAYEAGTAVDYQNANQDAFTALGNDIAAYLQAAKDALAEYDKIVDLKAEWQTKLNAIKAFIVEEDYSVIAADGVTYGQKLANIQAAIDLLQENLTAALAEIDMAHYNALVAVDRTDPVELQITKALFEADREQYQIDINVNAAKNLLTLVNNNIAAMQEVLNDITTYYTPEKLGNSFTATMASFNGIKDRINALSIPSEGSITADNASAKREELNKINSTLVKIREDFDKVKANADKAVKHVEANNAQKTAVDTEMATVLTNMALVTSSNTDPKRVDEFLTSYNTLLETYNTILSKINTSYAAETLIADYNGDGTAAKPGIKKEIAKLTTSVNAEKDEAVASTDNWNAYQSQLSTVAAANFYTASTPNAPAGLFDAARATINALATSVNAGQTFYLNKVNGYETQLNTLNTNITNNYNQRKSTAFTSTVTSTVNTLKSNIPQAATDATNNENAHNEQVAAQEKTQATWSRVYNKLSAEDKSTQIQGWLDQLTAKQLEINALDQTVASNFTQGSCYSSDAVAKYTAIEAFVLGVEASWEDPNGYDAALAQDNLDRYNRFTSAIAATKGEYDKAVTSLAKFSNIDPSQRDIFNIVLSANEQIFAYNQRIRNLRAKANGEYTAASQTKRGVYDLEEGNVATAQQYAHEIEGIYNDATAQLNVTAKKSLRDALRDAKAELRDAENDINTYDKSVKDKAFSDVKAIIREAEDAENDPELAVKLAGGFLTTLLNANQLLPAGREAAAQAQCDFLIRKVETEIADNRAKLQRSIAAGMLEQSYLDRYNESVELYITGEDGAKAQGEIYKAEGNMYDFGLSQVESCIGNFDQYNGLGSANDIVESNEAYADLQANAFAEVQALIDAAEDYANDYVAEYSHIADAQGYLDDIKYLADYWKDRCSVHTNKDKILGKCDGLKTTIEGLYATSDINEHAKLNEQLSQLRYEYYQAVAATSADISAYEAKLTGYEDELFRIYALAEVDGLHVKHRPYIALEKNIAKTRTELINIINAEQIANLYSGLKETIAAVNAQQQAEAELLAACHAPVQARFADAVAEVKTKSDAVAAAVEGYMAETTLVMYADNLNKALAALEEALDQMSRDIPAAQAPYTANEEAKVRLDAELQQLRDAYNELDAKLSTYGYVDIENFRMSAGMTALVYIQMDERDIQRAYESEDVRYMLNENSQLQYKSSVENGLANLDRTYSHIETQGRMGEVEGLKNEVIIKYNNSRLSPLAQDDIDQRISNANSGYSFMYEFEYWSYANRYTSNDIYGEQLKDEEGNNIVKRFDYIEEAVPAIFTRVDELKAQIAELDELIDANSYILGDVNRDKDVTVSDYMEILNAILGVKEMDPATVQFYAADINGDAKITIADLTSVVKIINGNVVPAQARALAHTQVNNSSDRLMLAAEGNGTKQRIAVSFDAAADYFEYAGCQMDITLPAGVSFVDAAVADRTAGFTLRTGDLGNGKVRVVLSSLEEQHFCNGSGAIFYLDVEVNHNYAGNGVAVDNILFTDNDVRIYSLPALDASETTGIGTVSMGEEVKEKIYSVSGKLVNGLKRGVNIIRGNDGSSKKVVVK